MKFLFRGVFPGERNLIAIRVCVENLWSRMCTTLVCKWPPGHVQSKAEKKIVFINHDNQNIIM